MTRGMTLAGCNENDYEQRRDRVKTGPPINWIKSVGRDDDSNRGPHTHIVTVSFVNMGFTEIWSM